MMTPTPSLTAWMLGGVAILFITSGAVSAKDIFVYDDTPNVRDYPAYRNTRQYKLRGPNTWQTLSESEWESQGGSGGLYDWEARTKHIRWSENECDKGVRIGRGSYKKRMMQSPIIMKKDLKCEDEHRPRGKSIAKCDFGKIQFLTTDHSVRANFVNCKKQPKLDFSHMPSFFTLKYMEVKVPSEHVVQTSSKRYRRYDGELTFAHYGMEGGLKDDIMNVAIFLKKGNKAHNDYEKFLRRWERFQIKKFKQCKMDWNVTDLCALKRRYSRNLGEDDFVEDSSPFSYANNTSLPWNSTALRAKNAEMANDEPYDEYSAGDVFEDEDPFTMHHMLQYAGIDDLLNNLNLNETVEHYEADNVEGEGDHRRLEPYRMYSKFFPNRHYWRYQGSTTTPPCYEHVKWRILQEPMIISTDQLTRTEHLIAKHLDKDCDFATVCAPRNRKDCKVSCNRPLLSNSYAHRLQSCHKFAKVEGRDPT